MLDQFEVITTLSFVDTYTHRLYPGSKVRKLKLLNFPSR